jgi:hypothetical protein
MIKKIKPTESGLVQCIFWSMRALNVQLEIHS